MATSSATFFRQMGGTLGTAVFLSVLFSTVGDKIAGLPPSLRRRTSRRPCATPPCWPTRQRERPRRRRSTSPGGRVPPVPRRHLVPQPPRPAAGPPVPRRVRRLDGPGVLLRGRHPRPRAGDRAVPAGGAAAHDVGPGGARRARGRADRADRCGTFRTRRASWVHRERSRTPSPVKGPVSGAAGTAPRTGPTPSAARAPHRGGRCRDRRQPASRRPPTATLGGRRPPEAGPRRTSAPSRRSRARPARRRPAPAGRGRR